MQSVSPLLLTASDEDGAGTATRRIHEGLQATGVDSEMLVRDKASDDPTIHGPTSKCTKVLAKVRPFLDSLPVRVYDEPTEYSVAWVPDRLHKRVEELDPDIVHLNWVGGGYMDISTVAKFDRPIIWRLPDMWPLTGGCHYSDGCTRYQSSCGQCPQLGSDHLYDPSRVTLKRKRRAIQRANVTVVATTSWLAECAAESSIFTDCPIEVIANGLNTDRFKPYDPSIGRELFGLPTEIPLILFGSVSPLSNDRKGYDLLSKALETLAANSETNAELGVFGASRPENPPDLGFPTHYTGYLNDEESLALLYSAADVMVVPSRYEGFGQTVTEAMACGTPVVSFDTTGPSEIIDHQETGYLATAYDPSDLASGIEILLSDESYRSELGKNARKRALERYDYRDIAAEYEDLYQKQLSSH